MMVGEEAYRGPRRDPPRWLQAFDLSGRVAAVELEVEALMRLAAAVVGIRDVARVPTGAPRSGVHRFRLGPPPAPVQAALVEGGW